jgi:threonine dehydratase
LHLKLEAMQVTGAFKVRGAVHAALRLSDQSLARGLVTASGGNHGLGVAWAGRALGVPVTIVLPANAPPVKARRIEALGATVIRHGTVWDDSDAWARAHAADGNGTYIHAFADPAVIAGQGTIALEWLAAVPDLDVLLVPIGGGGLISGIALAAHAIRPTLRIIGVEPVGAPTLKASIDAGALVTLPRIDTLANTLAPTRSEPVNLEIIQRHVESIILVTDDEMRAAARWLWGEAAIAAELSGAAATAAVLSRRANLEGLRVGAIVCGAGTAAFDAPEA